MKRTLVVSALFAVLALGCGPRDEGQTTTPPPPPPPEETTANPLVTFFGSHEGAYSVAGQHVEDPAAPVDFTGTGNIWIDDAGIAYMTGSAQVPSQTEPMKIWAKMWLDETSGKILSSYVNSGTPGVEISGSGQIEQDVGLVLDNMIPGPEGVMVTYRFILSLPAADGVAIKAELVAPDGTTIPQETETWTRTGDADETWDLPAAPAPTPPPAETPAATP